MAENNDNSVSYYAENFKSILNDYLYLPNTKANRQYLYDSLKDLFNQMSIKLRWLKTDEVFIDLMDTDIEFDVVQEDDVKMVLRPLNKDTLAIFKILGNNEEIVVK